MDAPIVYVAITPSLVEDLELDAQLAHLAEVARVERWEGPGNPTPAAVAHALGRGLLVTHANDSLAEAVAEFTLGAIIMARRNAFVAAARMRAGRERLPIAAQHEVRGSTIGIIGASAIGRRVMRLLAPLDVTLLLYDPYCTPEVAAQHGAKLVGLHELLRSREIVKQHATITTEK